MRLSGSGTGLGGRSTAMTAGLAVLAASGVAVIVVGASSGRGATTRGVTAADPGIGRSDVHLPFPGTAPTQTPGTRRTTGPSASHPVPHSGVVPHRSGSPSAPARPHSPRPVQPVAPPFGYAGPAMIGSSSGGSVSATQAQFPNMDVVRFYYPGAPSVWRGAIATIRSDRVIFVSFKYDVTSTAAGGSDVAFTQVLHSWAASGRQIYWTWQHEADNPGKGISQAAFRAGWAHLLADAAAVHASNLHSMSILMGVALNGSHGPVEGWYVPGVDVLGFDCYYLDTELLAERYAAAKHKHVAFPEFGAGIGGSADATAAAFARNFIGALDRNTIAAVWFNNNGNNLSTHPQTLGILRSAAGS